MLLKFVKNCPWALSGTGRVKVFAVDSTHEIEKSEALPMIFHGYAEEVIEEQEEDLDAMQEEQEEQEEDLDNSRFQWYNSKYSLIELKQFCTDNKIKLNTGFHRTKPLIIDKILKAEQNHGQFKTENKI